MLQIVPFKASHLFEMKEQTATEHLRKFVTPEHAKALEAGTRSFSVLKDGEVIACGGIVEFWPTRGELWAVLSEVCGKHMTALSRAVARFIDECQHTRLEIVVDPNFYPALRWATMFGFTVENPKMRSYWPDGRDAMLLVLVR